MAGTGIIEVDATSLLDANLIGVTSNGTIDTTQTFIGQGSAAAKTAITQQSAETPAFGVATSTLIIEEGADVRADSVLLEEGRTLRGNGRGSCFRSRHERDWRVSAAEQGDSRRNPRCPLGSRGLMR